MMTKWDLYGFIDESGTAGVQTSENEYLILSLVIFKTEQAMKSVHIKYAALRENLGLKETYEFHYTHNRKRTRDKVFAVIEGIDFDFMTFAVKKDSMKGHASYATLAEMVTNWLFKKNSAIKILIDTNPVLLKELNKIKKAKNVKNVQFRQGDSVLFDCLQLVDYIAGAHGKIIRGQREDNFEKIRKKLKLLQIYHFD